MNIRVEEINFFFFTALKIKARDCLWGGLCLVEKRTFDRWNLGLHRYLGIENLFSCEPLCYHLSALIAVSRSDDATIDDTGAFRRDDGDIFQARQTEARPPSIGSNGERVGISGCIVRDLVPCQFRASTTVADAASSPR